MLVIIGFFFMVAVASLATVFCVLCLFFNLQRYNIGGVPNSWMLKVGTLLYALAVCLMWVWVMSISPFTLAIKV